MECREIDYTRYYVKNIRNNSADNESSKHVIKQDKKSGQKGNKTQNKHHRLPKVVAVLLLIIGVVFLISDAVKGGYIIQSIETLVHGGGVKTTYYGVEMNVFEDIDSARVYSNEIRKAEGGGYVLFDEGYRVLVEVYSSHEDAENVAKKLRLEGENARVYPFEIRDIDYTLFPDSTRNIVKSTIAFNERVYRRLYEVSVELAESRIDDNSAKMRVKGIRDETHNVIAEYTANVDNAISNTNVLKVKAELVSIESMLDNLAHDVVKRPNLLSDIRYTSCLIVNSYRELAKELSSE